MASREWQNDSNLTEPRVSTGLDAGVRTGRALLGVDSFVSVSESADYCCKLESIIGGSPAS